MTARLSWQVAVQNWVVYRKDFICNLEFRGNCSTPTLTT
jgi:hypothetical protein